MKLNPANIYARRLLSQATQQGVRAENIGIVEEPHLKIVSEWSLMGDRISSVSVDLTKLTDYERSLRSKNPSILLIVDIDGVLVDNPFTSIISEFGKANMNWLNRAVSVVNRGIIWTNRFSPKRGLFYKSSLFPFLGLGAALEFDGEITGSSPFTNNVEIITGKVAKKRGETLEMFINQEKADIAYYVGSSWFDGRAVVEYAKRTTTPYKLKYFHTGHLIL